MPAKPGVQALLFDVFGTVVDWRSSLIDDLGRFGAEKGIVADWAAFADDWRALYQPAMEAVRSGRRAWTILDVLHRESLESLLAKYGIAGLGEADKDHINRVWHRLRPWPDAVPGLQRLKARFIIGTLSNGNVGLLTRLAKHAGLPWDVVLGAETARAYKPLPQAYLASAALLNLEPRAGHAGRRSQRRPRRRGRGGPAHQLRGASHRAWPAPARRPRGRAPLGRGSAELHRPRRCPGSLGASHRADDPLER